MKFKAKFQPELCVSTDATRRHLLSVHLDKAKSSLIATNGHMLVKVPCTVEPGDSDGAITPETMREARRASKRRRYDKKDDDLPRVRAGKKLLDTGGAIFRRPDEGKFPPWEAVMPKFKPGDKDTVTFGINPYYLLAVIKAMGGSGGLTPLARVTIKVTKDMLEPILVTASSEEDGAIAVVMPGRV